MTLLGPFPAPARNGFGLDAELGFELNVCVDGVSGGSFDWIPVAVVWIVLGVRLAVVCVGLLLERGLFELPGLLFVLEPSIDGCPESIWLSRWADGKCVGESCVSKDVWACRGADGGGCGNETWLIG